MAFDLVTADVEKHDVINHAFMTCSYIYISWQQCTLIPYALSENFYTHKMRKVIGRIIFILIFLIVTNAKENQIRRIDLGVDFTTIGYIPAMNLALETINNDTTLPFSFDVIRSDSMVSI